MRLTRTKSVDDILATGADLPEDDPHGQQGRPSDRLSRRLGPVWLVAGLVVYLGYGARRARLAGDVSELPADAEAAA